VIEIFFLVAAFIVDNLLQHCKLPVIKQSFKLENVQKPGFTSNIFNSHIPSLFVKICMYCRARPANSQNRVGRYFDILIYRDIFNCDYCIEGRNLSDDISKLYGRRLS
jgi:hypothetical protein